MHHPFLFDINESGFYTRCRISIEICDIFFVSLLKDYVYKTIILPIFYP